MRRDVFVETNNVQALRTAVGSACGAGRGYPAMVMTYGEAGTGKTVAARMLFSEFGGVYLRAMEQMSQHAFLQELCFEVDGSRPHGSYRCKQTVLRRLDEAPAPIFVDEADRLDIRRLEDLRDIHDVTGSPVVLIGEMGLPTRVNARTRINDRIPAALRVHFDSISRQDILLYAAQTADLRLTPEAAAHVHTATRGNFRRVHNAVLSIEGTARAAGTSDVDLAMCRAALGMGTPAGRQ